MQLHGLKFLAASIIFISFPRHYGICKCDPPPQVILVYSSLSLEAAILTSPVYMYCPMFFFGSGSHHLYSVDGGRACAALQE